MKIEQYFRQTYTNTDILFTNSGRAALQATVEDLHLQNSSMILPAFICYDVFSLLLKQNNIKPVLVDCPENSFNITLNNIKKQYSKYKNKEKIKSVLIVHTFGKINEDIENIANFCKENKIILIEDCAHILDLRLSGDAAIFTFNKVTNIPVGGAYIKNKGKIKVKPRKYKINSLDIYRILNSNNLGKLLIKILKFFKTKEKIKVNPEKIEILASPKFLSFFPLKKKFKMIPLLTENRDKEFSKLINQGIRAEKYWIPVFPGYKNAKNFSEKIIVRVL